MGLKEFQEQRMFGQRQPCPHARLWEIAGIIPEAI